jgi:hypothetical protein
MRDARSLSNRNALDLIEGDLIACAVIELGGARTFMRGHELGVFERAAGFEVGGDTGCPESVAADLDLHAEQLQPAEHLWRFVDVAAPASKDVISWSRYHVTQTTANACSGYRNRIHAPAIADRCEKCTPYVVMLNLLW